MAKAKQLRRKHVLFIRLSDAEHAAVNKRCASLGLTREEYGRCMLFNIPFEHFSGRLPKRAAKPEQSVPATGPSEATEATL